MLKVKWLIRVIAIFVALLMIILPLLGYADEDNLFSILPGKPIDEVALKRFEADQERKLVEERKLKAQQKAVLRKLVRDSEQETLQKIIAELYGSRQKIVDFAYSKIGLPYLWGATGPSKYDCSGLTQQAYRSAGISIPRHSLHQKEYGKKISKYQAKPGDIVYIKGHVGLYVGNDKIVEASGSGSTGRVIESSINDERWSKKNPVFVKIIND